MGAFDTLNKRARIGAPPSRQQTFQTLERTAQPTRRIKTGRTEQLNVRVTAGFKQRFEDIAAAAKQTLGSLLDAMLAAYEGGGATPGRSAPLAEERAGRTKALRLWATEDLFNTIGKIAAERKLSVSALFEDLVAREVKRLDPQGGKFGVYVKGPQS